MGWRLRLTRAEPGFVPWDVQHLLPAPSALLAPFSSPPWDPPGCVSWSCQAFPIPAHPPLTSPNLLPVQANPRALSHPLIVPGAPSLVAWGGGLRRGSSFSPQAEEAIRGPRATLSTQKDPSCPAGLLRAEPREGTGRVVKGSLSAPGGRQGQAGDGASGVGGLWMLGSGCSAHPPLCFPGRGKASAYSGLLSSWISSCGDRAGV